jgi:hypothetical protein
MAGPIARPMFTGSAFSATARLSSDGGTSSAVIACQVDVFIATPMPSANVKASNVVAVMRSANASTASSTVAASIQVWVTSSSWRRSTSREREIVAVREQRIDGAEHLVSGLVTAGRRVDLKTQTRRPAEGGNGVPAAAADGPGADAFAADVSELPHRFEVPVEACSGAGVSHIQVVAPLVAAGIEKASTVANEARVVGRQLAGADVLALGPQASVLQVPAREIIERMLVVILNRLTPEPDDAPLALLPVQPDGVVGLPDVRTVANRDEALQIERHLLPSHASLQRAPQNESTYATNARRRVVQLEALAQGEAERHVALRVVKRERDIFQAVERFGSEARVLWSAKMSSRCLFFKPVLMMQATKDGTGYHT